MSDVQYLRNEKGEISMMPLIGWHFDSFSHGIMAQFQFAETPEDLAAGMLGVVQLAVSAEQAMQLAAIFSNLGNEMLAKQAKHPKQ